jgi:glycine oxidase
MGGWWNSVPMYPWRYPNAVNHLAQHGKQLYQQWNEKLQPMTGIDFQIHDTGMLIFDEADFELGLNYADHYQDPMQHCDYLKRAVEKSIRIFQHSFNMRFIFRIYPMLEIHDF